MFALNLAGLVHRTHFHAGVSHGWLGRGGTGQTRRRLIPAQLRVFCHTLVIMSFLRIAHRGGAGHGPGNTLLAIERALGMGADLIEVDVRHTLDRQLVVLHDRFLQPSTNGTGRVNETPLSQIGRLRTQQESQPIPTLLQVLQTVSGRAGLMIEMKEFGLAESVIAAVRESGFPGPLFYASFLHSELLSIRERDPSAASIALLEAIPLNPTAFAVDAQATHAGLSIDSIDAAFVRDLHQGGFKVFVYTADQPEDIAYARTCRVDGIISNFIDRL